MNIRKNSAVITYTMELSQAELRILYDAVGRLPAGGPHQHVFEELAKVLNSD